MEKYYRNSVIEINLDTIKNNINEVKEKCSKDKFLYAVIKGDAYGHGIVQVANTVIKSNADGIAVATFDEAIIVRKYHKDIKILCLGIIRDEDVIEACNSDITIIAANLSSVKYMSQLSFEKKLNVQLKVNTGMNRIGVKTVSELKEFIELLSANKDINIDGIFMHFATAEDYDKVDYLNMQLNKFKEVVQELNYPFNQIHCTNSASLLKFNKNIDFTNTNRAGICLYGALEDVIQNEYNINSAFVLKTKINMVQVHDKGQKIGYSNRYTTEKDGEIVATIPIGYADGFARLHTGSKVKCNDQYGVVVGSVCMDQTMIKFDNMVNIGDEVFLISDDPEINVYKRCKEAQTITHEIFARFSNRVPKIYYEDNKIVEIDNALLKK